MPEEEKRADAAETERVMDSVDRVNGAVLGTHRILSEKHFDADIAMEREENDRIWSDPGLSTEEKARLSRENHAFHNSQRVKAQQETLSAAADATVRMNAAAGKVAAWVKIAGAGAAGGLMLSGLGAMAGLKGKDLKNLALLGAALGAGGGTVAFAEGKDAAPETRA